MPDPDEIGEGRKPHQFVGKTREARVEPAGVGDHEHPRSRDDFVFGPCAATVLFAKVRLIDTEPDEADDPRPQLIELALEDCAPYLQSRPA